MSEDQLFRKESLERISSPEELHDYMRVTSPRLWMILTAILLLLGGFIVYASTATLESTMPIRVTITNVENTKEDQAEGGNEYSTAVSGTLPLSEKDKVATGMTVRIGGETGRISLISVSEKEKEIFMLIDMEHDYIPMQEGEYDAELVLESTTPVSFLWN